MSVLYYGKIHTWLFNRKATKNVTDANKIEEIRHNHVALKKCFVSAKCKKNYVSRISDVFLNIYERAKVCGDLYQHTNCICQLRLQSNLFTSNKKKPLFLSSYWLKPSL